MSGSARHLGGVLEPGVATVHPALLVRGLRARALEAGVQIHENSPMLSMDKTAAGTIVRAAQGEVRAGAVVLATNAALAGYREVRRNLLILGSDVVATAAVPERLRQIGWRPGLAISDSRRLVHYYRTTYDGRVVFGKGGGRLGFAGRVDSGFTGASRRSAEVAEHLFRTYPQLRGSSLTHSWTGAIDYSADGLPFFGALASHPGAFYVAGFSGDGVGPSYIAGQVLASLALGLTDQWAANPLIRQPRGKLPPEPIRYLGGQLVRLAIAHKESREDAGEKVSYPLSLMASLDPTSFVG